MNVFRKYQQNPEHQEEGCSQELSDMTDNVPMNYLTLTHINSGDEVSENAQQSSPDHRRVQSFSDSVPTTDLTMEHNNTGVLIETAELDMPAHRRRQSFTYVRELGSGAFGVVSLGFMDGKEVAYKTLKNVHDDEQFNCMIKEMNTMSNLRPHPNLVNLLGVCTEEMEQKQIYLILEYCPLGDLKTFFMKHRDQFTKCIKKVPGYLESDCNANLLKYWSLCIAKVALTLSEYQ